MGQKSVNQKMNLNKEFLQWLRNKYIGNGTPGSYTRAVKLIGDFYNVNLFDTDQGVDSIKTFLHEFLIGLSSHDFLKQNQTKLDSFKSYFKKGWLKPAIDNYLEFLFIKFAELTIADDLLDYDLIEKSPTLTQEEVYKSHFNDVKIDDLQGIKKVKRNYALVKTALKKMVINVQSMAIIVPS